jgi:hypothetical protein
MENEEEKSKYYPHLRDFAEPDEDEEPLDGDKKKIAEIQNKEILVLNFRIQKSKIKDGNYAIIQFVLDNKKYVIFTTARRVMKKLERHKDKMPYLATVIQKYKYYTMI